MANKLLSGICLIILLLVQLLLIVFFSSERFFGHGVSQYALLVGLQVGISVPIGFALAGLFRYDGWKERCYLMILVTIFNGFIPLIGLVVIALSLFFMKPLPPLSDQQEMVAITRPDYVPSLETLGSKFGDGGARIRLFDDEAMNAVRRAALLAISSRQGIDNNRLLLAALNESNDEIRLLAYSLLDLQEQAISRSIEQATLQLEKDNSPKKVVMLNKHLARLYQELVYRSLVQADVMEQAQQDAIKHATLIVGEQWADKAEHDDAGMYLLLGQICKKREEIEQAKQALEKAHACGVPPSSVLPALAEIYYRQRHFAQVIELMTESSALVHMQKIGSVARFWRGAQHANR